MTQTTRILLAIGILFLIIAGVMGIETLRGQQLSVEDLPPGSIPIYQDGLLVGGFTPDDLAEIDQVSFTDVEEGKPQEGWLLSDVLQLNVKSRALNPETQIVTRFTAVITVAQTQLGDAPMAPTGTADHMMFTRYRSHRVSYQLSGFTGVKRIDIVHPLSGISTHIIKAPDRALRPGRETAYRCGSTITVIIIWHNISQRIGNPCIGIIATFCYGWKTTLPGIALFLVKSKPACNPGPLSLGG